MRPRRGTPGSRRPHVGGEPPGVSGGVVVAERHGAVIGGDAHGARRRHFVDHADGRRSGARRPRHRLAVAGPCCALPAWPIRLYTFQANLGARRFYERHGFSAIEFTDGEGNRERCPDVLYELAPEARPSRSWSPGMASGQPVPSFASRRSPALRHPVGLTARPSRSTCFLWPHVDESDHRCHCPPRARHRQLAAYRAHRVGSPSMNIERWTGSAIGRSRTVAFGDRVDGVRMLERRARTSGPRSRKVPCGSWTRPCRSPIGPGRLLSVQVIPVGHRAGHVRRQWRAWIGPTPPLAAARGFGGARRPACCST